MNDQHARERHIAEVVAKQGLTQLSAALGLDGRASHQTATVAPRNLRVALEEFGRVLRAELDYELEGRNPERFAANFDADHHVRIPRVYWETTTANVITLERMRGIKVTDLDALDEAGVDRHAPAQRATRATATMVFDHGFFHGDPHPGNFFVQPDGAIAIIDFGMVGELDDSHRGQALAPFAERQLLVKLSPAALLRRLERLGVAAAELPDHVRRLLDDGIDVHVRTTDFEPVVERLERLGNRIAVSVLAAAVINSVAELTAAGRVHPGGWRKPHLAAQDHAGGEVVTRDNQTGATAEMTAMVLTTDRRTALERRPLPSPRDDQVLVDVDLCGICGTDLHAPETPEVLPGGFILGHEAAGRIARVGRDVGGWRVGQRVAINPNGDTCGVCEACRSGRLNHCVPATLERAIGLQADGSLAAQVAVSPKTLHALPDDMGRVESAWIEPAATALRAVLLAGELAERSVLVVGGGPVGHLCCRLARHFGAGRVFLSEPSAERRSYAEASRVDRAFDPSSEAEEIERLNADIVVECSGSEAGVRGALAAARPEGTVIIVGGAHTGLDPLTILVKELRVQGSFVYVDEFAAVIPLLTGGDLKVADLTSEIVGIDDAPAAFERLREASTMKIFIAPNGTSR